MGTKETQRIIKEYYNFKRHNMVSFTGLGGKRGRTGSYD